MLMKAHKRPMKSLLFVHGTGVRKESYDTSIKQIREGLAKRPDFRVEECRWGESVGIKLGKDPKSVPSLGKRGLFGDSEEADPMVRLWGLLCSDPLYELAEIGSEAEM